MNAKDIIFVASTPITRSDNASCFAARTTGELDELLVSQADLVNKLRCECRRLAQQLEDITKKYK